MLRSTELINNTIKTLPRQQTWDSLATGYQNGEH